MSDQNKPRGRQRRFTSASNSGGNSNGGNYKPASNAVLQFDHLTADGGDKSSLKFERDASGKVTAAYGEATLMNDAFDGAAEKGTKVKVKVADGAISRLIGYLENAPKSLGANATMIGERSYLNNGEVTVNFLKGFCKPEDVNGVNTYRILPDRLAHASEIKRVKRGSDGKAEKDANGRFIRETVGAKVDVAVTEDACDMFSSDLPPQVEELMKSLQAERAEAGDGWAESHPFEDRWLTDFAEQWADLPPFFRMEAVWDASVMTQRYQNDASSFGFALRKFSQFDLDGNEVAPGAAGSLMGGRIFGGSVKDEDGNYNQKTFAEALEDTVGWGVPNDKQAATYDEMVENGIMGALEKNGLITTDEEGNPKLLTKMNPVLLEDLDFYQRPESLTEEVGVALEVIPVTTTNFGGESVKSFAADDGEAIYNPLEGPVQNDDGSTMRFSKKMFVKSTLVMHHPGRIPTAEAFFATKVSPTHGKFFRDKQSKEVTAYPEAAAYTLHTVPTKVSEKAGFGECLATKAKEDLDSVNDFKIKQKLKNGGQDPAPEQANEGSGPSNAPGM